MSIICKLFGHKRNTGHVHAFKTHVVKGEVDGGVNFSLCAPCFRCLERVDAGSLFLSTRDARDILRDCSPIDHKR